MKRKLEVEAEEEEAIEPEVMVNTVETLEVLEATEVVIEREVTEEEAREASEEEEVETEAARSQKMTRSNNQNLKSELRTPLPRSEITDLRNFLISSNTTNMKWWNEGKIYLRIFRKLSCLLRCAIWGDFIDSIQIGSIKTAEIEPNLKNLEPGGLLVYHMKDENS